MTTRGFASFQSALLSLMGVIRGSFDFWHFLHHWPVMTHVYFYSFYAFAYGLFIGLVIAVVLDTYKITHQSMFFKSSLDTQDHEMIEFMMKRFKLWAGITKQKPVSATHTWCFIYLLYRSPDPKAQKCRGESKVQLKAACMGTSGTRPVLVCSNTSFIVSLVFKVVCSFVHMWKVHAIFNFPVTFH